MTASASLVAAASTSPYLACSTAASARSPRVRWTSTPPTTAADARTSATTQSPTLSRACERRAGFTGAPYRVSVRVEVSARPDREVARVVGLRPLALFDAARARDVYPLACAQGLRCGALLTR